MTDLDSILSGKSAVASEPEKIEEAKPQSPGVEPDEGGKTEGAESEGQKMVPHEALHAEKQKVKRYTEQVAEFDRKLTEREAAWERRFEQLLTKVAPSPALEPAAKPDIWADPDAYVKSALDPVQRDLQKQREDLSQLMAEEKHGAEAVTAAFQALAAEMQANPQGTAGQYQAIMQSRHPYGALVDWHKKREAANEIGDDPAAYREKLKAELLAEFQQNPPQQQVQQAPVMPSNLAGARNVGTRSGPAWSGPQSLNDIFDRRPGK